MAKIIINGHQFNSVVIGSRLYNVAKIMQQRGDNVSITEGDRR